ncbi:hypothetical protein HYU07_02290 [Candidatus Woesearchaeota archaeon]|nr:hypothetical protein [Candidatus Woesearchaeota archaeon]
MDQKVSKDTPLAEITLRRYEKPQNLEKRDLVKKLCLSLGLLQPGDSRDVVVDILYVLLEAKKNKKELSSVDVEEQVKELRKSHKLAMLGVAGSNIRRQLKRLRDLFLIEKTGNMYRITEHSMIFDVFNEKIESFLLSSILTRVKEYVKKIDEEFK